MNIENKIKEIIKKENYCKILNCNLPVYQNFVCKNHEKDFINEIKNISKEINESKIDSILDKYIVNKIEKKDLIEKAIKNTDEAIKFLSDNNIIQYININECYNDFRTIVDDYYKNRMNDQEREFLDQLSKPKKNNLFDKSIILSIFDHIKKCQYIPKKNNLDNSAHKYIYNKLLEELSISDKKNNLELIEYIRHIIKDENLLYKSKKVDINYNFSLYSNFVKLLDKYFIVYYKREKLYEELKYVNSLRFDLFGIMLNKNDQQLYYFVIELDDNTHFNNEKSVYKDILKEIFIWKKCFSMLRIHYLDDMYEQIDLFLNELTINRTPIIKYSRNHPYIERLSMLT
ncbi:hypothetical protein Catovirus_2_1 [Catovirus CTV1]|uniref:DUF2726 domain-containing protein n=1 Tax=Catovirus CTV1 TaxID=1977631 RepID=A0A1V0SBH3_9VIRU|nr:hypothetical protein Catovirus_2_1 [Catovirus CTV1]